MTIDDMQQLDVVKNGMSGYWYTYSDRTVPNSLPVSYLSDAGFVSPMENSPEFPPSNDGNGPLVEGAVRPYRRIDAWGEKDWGVGFGMDFVDAQPDGGAIPVNECDAGQVWATDKNIPQPFDASQWTGIKFYARSFGGKDVAVEIHIDDDRTSPWGQVPLATGGCNACVSSGADASACSDSFSNISTPDPALSTPITFPGARWTPIYVPFTSLHSGNWANILQATDPIHTNRIYNLHFQVSTSKGTSLPPFSIGVSYISFYKK